MSKDNKKSRKEIYKEKRSELIAISQPLRLLVKEGVYSTVNEGLREMYEEQYPGIVEFNTFNQWKQKGCTILKGSQAFLFWGQPREYSQAADNGEPEEYKYFPMAYLFSNEQVFNPEAVKEKEPAFEPEPEPAELDI
jgi:hypothetical protein